MTMPGKQRPSPRARFSRNIDARSQGHYKMSSPSAVRVSAHLMMEAAGISTPLGYQKKQQSLRFIKGDAVPWLTLSASNGAAWHLEVLPTIAEIKEEE